MFNRRTPTPHHGDHDNALVAPRVPRHQFPWQAVVALTVAIACCLVAAQWAFSRPVLGSKDGADTVRRTLVLSPKAQRTIDAQFYGSLAMRPEIDTVVTSETVSIDLPEQGPVKASRLALGEIPPAHPNFAQVSGAVDNRLGIVVPRGWPGVDEAALPQSVDFLATHTAAGEQQLPAPLTVVGYVEGDSSKTQAYGSPTLVRDLSLRASGLTLDQWTEYVRTMPVHVVLKDANDLRALAKEASQQGLKVTQPESPTWSLWRIVAWALCLLAAGLLGVMALVLVRYLRLHRQDVADQWEADKAAAHPEDLGATIIPAHAPKVHHHLPGLPGHDDHAPPHQHNPRGETASNADPSPSSARVPQQSNTPETPPPPSGPGQAAPTQRGATVGEDTTPAT